MALPTCWAVVLFDMKWNVIVAIKIPAPERCYFVKGHILPVPLVEVMRWWALIYKPEFHWFTCRSEYPAHWGDVPGGSETA